jgi:hypothetical protein
MQEHTFTGRIASLVVFRVPEFGTRARFTIEDTGRYSVVCAVEGDVAREFIARFCAGDNITVRGIYEPRPSTAAANTPWVPRYRVRAVQVAEDIRLATYGRARPMRPEFRCCYRMISSITPKEAALRNSDSDIPLSQGLEIAE